MKQSIRKMIAPARLPKATGVTGAGNKPAGFPPPSKARPTKKRK